MLYLLSKLVPVRMHSTYGVCLDGESWIERATWWQWRGRILSHTASPLDFPACG